MIELVNRKELMDAFRKYMAENFDKERCISEENCETCEHGCLWRTVVMSVPAVTINGD